MKLAGSLPFLLALAPLAFTACVADSLPVGMLDGSTGSGSGSSGAAEPSGGGTGAEASSTTSGDGTTSAGSDTDADSSTGVPDDGLCNILDPSCPSGQKCMPWSSDGDSDWDAWGCFPLDEDPVGVGEPCLWNGEGFTGIDVCEEGSMCWEVDPSTNLGTCVPFCLGTSERDLSCADPALFCDIIGDGTPYLCSPWCDPLAPDCPEGRGCSPEANWWVCGPKFPGDTAAYGEPCEFVHACDPGLVCVVAEAVPQCESSVGCCTEVCDLDDPLGDAQCSGAAQGQTCQPWYDEGDAPSVLDHVGICRLP